MQFAAITTAHAQVPRGESPESLEQDAESGLAILPILAVIAIYTAFKRSRREGLMVLGFCIALVLLLFLFPILGMFVVGILVLMIGWGLFHPKM